MLHQSGFARAVWSKYAHQVPTMDLKIDILQDKGSLVTITEIHIFKDDQRFASFNARSGFRFFNSFAHLPHTLNHPFRRELDLAMIDLGRKIIYGAKVFNLPC